jgi:hypothetical protein
MGGKPSPVVSARFAVGLINLFTDLQNRRKVRDQSRLCRIQGMTDAMRDTTLAAVTSLAVLTDHEDASEQYRRSWLDNSLRTSLPGLDPATILLLVQLAIMIYQALQAVGFLDADGLSAVSPATINEHFGGL